MVHTENAPELERMLHQRFSAQRVNMVNERKEFFRVNLDDVERAVREITERLPRHMRREITFTRTALAEEYRGPRRDARGPRGGARDVVSHIEAAGALRELIVTSARHRAAQIGGHRSTTIASRQTRALGAAACGVGRTPAAGASDVVASPREKCSAALITIVVTVSTLTSTRAIVLALRRARVRRSLLPGCFERPSDFGSCFVRAALMGISSLSARRHLRCRARSPIAPAVPHNISAFLARFHREPVGLLT